MSVDGCFRCDLNRDEMADDAVKYAPCSVCGREMRVKKDGTIGHHGGPQGQGWMGNRAYRCKGCDLPPQPETPA